MSMSATNDMLCLQILDKLIIFKSMKILQEILQVIGLTIHFFSQKNSKYINVTLMTINYTLSFFI